MPSDTAPRYGAFPRAAGTTFSVWAPHFDRLELVLRIGDGERVVPMPEPVDGVRTLEVEGVGAGTRYSYRTPAGDFPDPASRFQPEGVHGPSEVVDASAYTWGDAGWSGIAREDLVFYELHVGTFSPEGTFGGVRARLDHLRELGVTAIQLMPVADFPGSRNWGYDPAALFAPSRAYGRPDDLRALVDAAHGAGLAVFLDVVYNHFGPDGAYAPAFAPFFTDRHDTPWGQAINLDDAGSRHVRAFLVQNALHWLRDYHLDGLRLDATHAIIDDSDEHFLALLAREARALPGPRRWLVAEDGRNERRLLDAPEAGGYGLDGVWADDFHHQVRNLLAGDAESYYADFAGTTAADLAATIRRGWFFTGQDAPAYGGPRGTDPSGLGLDRFVVCIQNHDQVGNRAHGDRLTASIGLDAYRAASALLAFVPETPLLFMGQEWAARTPFQYFTDHNDELGRAVSEGRKREFARFASFGQSVPDPQDAATCARSRLDWPERDEDPHVRVLRLYRALLSLRRELGGRLDVRVHGDRALTIRRGAHALLLALAPGQTLPVPDGSRVLLDTEDPRFAVDGQPARLDGGQAHFAVPSALIVLL